tara:strand:- start:4 stop:966 length:963 start_codon:yes stop_codon:yes gene_type:complete
MARKLHFLKIASLKTSFRLCLFLFLIFLPRNSLLAKPFEFMKIYAEGITIGIETPASSGSGFLIGKKNSEYFFLTAGHVAISDPTKEEFWVYSLVNGEEKKYKVNKFIKPKEFNGKDIVIGSFKTKDILPYAIIFPIDKDKFVPPPPKLPFYTYEPFQSYNDRYFNSKWQIQGPPIVAGISIPTRSINIPLFRYSEIKMLPRAKGNQNGYEAIYLAISTVPGMSGGPIIGSRVCAQKNPEYYESYDWGGLSNSGAYPGVIGMHGMSEEYLNSGGRSGTSLGIPLDLIVDYLGENAESYGVLVGRGYYDEVLGMCKMRLRR